MGCNCSGCCDGDKVRRFEERLYALCLKIELDSDHNRFIPFVEKFRLENTNELGQVFNEQSAKIIILEFRKFLFLCAARICSMRRSTGSKVLKPIIYKDIDVSVAYECPYSAPPYIDRVWKSFISYGDKYKQICYKICQGYMMRIDPLEGMPQGFRDVPGLNRYNLCREDMYFRQVKTHPFHNLWPQYQKPEEYVNDWQYTVCATQQKVNEFITFIGQSPKELGEVNSRYCIDQSIRINDQFQRQFPPECQGRPSYNQENFKYNPEEGEGWSTEKDVEEVEQAAKDVYNHEFPENFVGHIMREVMISEQQALDLLFEYRRFMILEGLTEYKMYPSQPIERVWLIHMGYSSNYIKLCKKLPDNTFVKHIPLIGDTKGFEDNKDYETTLKIYKLIFDEIPPTAAWAPVEIRFAPENFTCVYINLIRLAGMYNAQVNGCLKYNTNAAQPANPAVVIVTDGQVLQRQELRETIKAKKQKRRAVTGGGGAHHYDSGDDFLLIYGGLMIIDNPNTCNYNDPGLLGFVKDGFHDGLSILTDISFSDIQDVGEGVLGAFEAIDWPDLDFQGFGDTVGELYGNAGEFAGVFGKGVVDAAEGVGEFAAEGAVLVGEGFVAAAGFVGEHGAGIAKGIAEIAIAGGEAIIKGIGFIAEAIGNIDF